MVTGLIVLVIIILAGGGLYFAINQISTQPIPIDDIRSNMRRYDGEIVTVQGEVCSRIKIAGFQCFEIKDDTGKIHIITARGLPNQGEIVTVTGVVDQLLTAGTVTLIVIKEPDVAN